jgi:hypothetical protein
VSAFVTAGAGFLLAVLWFVLMFDVQTLGHSERELPEQVLASIAAYYRRVTTAARPMNRLIAAVMLATLGCVIAQIARAEQPRWVGWATLALVAAAVLLALAHTVPSAVALGTRADSRARQSAQARSICRDHLLCAAAITTALVLQLSLV